MSGFGEGLSNLLGVGNARANAFDEGQKTASDLTYRSAQTEGALANAREAQAKAIAQEKVNELKAQLANNPNALATADDETLGRLILSGLGGDYASAQKGHLDQQQYGNRATVINPASNAEQRLRALQLEEGKPSADITKVGKGYVDLTQDDQKVQFLGDEVAGDLSNAGKNYNFEQELIRKGATPAQIANFREYGRAERVVNAGGVPTFAGGSPVIDPSTVATNIGNNAAAKFGAIDAANARAELPEKLASVQRYAADIDELLSAPGFDTIYGVSGKIDPRNYIPGTDASNATVLRDKLSAEAFAVAVQQLRGLGQLSNVEGQTLKAAFTEANDPRLSAQQSRRAYAKLRTELQLASQRAIERASRGETVTDDLTPGTPTSYPDSGQQGSAPAAGANRPGSRTSSAPAPATPLPRVNARGWTLKRDANGNQAYVSPDGQSFEEVQ